MELILIKLGIVQQSYGISECIKICQIIAVKVSAGTSQVYETFKFGEYA
jgi:hypothetical protein